jgi:hypothetical protein
MAAIAAIAAIPMSGCASAPSIGVLGAYFPDWLFCIVAGVVLTVVIYLIIKRLQADHLTWNALILSTRNRCCRRSLPLELTLLFPVGTK